MNIAACRNVLLDARFARQIRRFWRGASPSFETVVSNEVRGKGAARGPIAARRVKPKTICLF
ncbi:MAG TPA: hypothetical protein H9790_02080 [Candidatus Agathobaculum intestinipullorum]|nr:hypothetical protein [Candidatus Agathobaculum intestinipullorum]